jgi:polyferredoxin
MSLFAWMKTGFFDVVMPSAIVIIIGAIVLSLLFKRGFCGWICPVGTVGAAAGSLGRFLLRGRNLNVPRWLDIILRIPKYVVAGMLLFWLSTLPPEVALQFQTLPYYATSDLKILYGIIDPAWWYVAIGVSVAATSVLWGNTWCRYLCPLGAVYGAVSSASVGTVGRDAESCIDCGKCTSACTARIDVASAGVVRSTECDGCQDCVRACPQPGALSARLFGVPIPWVAWPVLLVLIWMLVYALAVGTGHWTHGLPDSTVAEYMRAMKLTPDF